MRFFTKVSSFSRSQNIQGRRCRVSFGEDSALTRKMQNSGSSAMTIVFSSPMGISEYMSLALDHNNVLCADLSYIWTLNVVTAEV